MRINRQLLRRLAWIGFLAIAGFFLLTEHRAHRFGWWPLLLLLACPLLHVFWRRLSFLGGAAPFLDRCRQNRERAVRWGGKVQIAAAGLLGAIVLVHCLWIRTNVRQPMLVGPDEESAQWVEAVASGANAPYLVLRKVRGGDREVNDAGNDWQLRTAGLVAPVGVGVHAYSPTAPTRTCWRKGPHAS